MSTWTHVTGSISADVIGGIPLFGGDEGPGPAEMLRKVTGTWINGWHREPGEYWPDALEDTPAYGMGPLLPSGSEGPMKYVAQNMGSRSSMNNGLVTFWGNLRDFDDTNVEKEMIPYFKALLARYEESGIHVRNMAIEIDVEGGKRLLLTTGASEDGESVVLKIKDISEEN